MTNPSDPGHNSCTISTCPSCALQSAGALELGADSWVVSCSNCGLVGPIAGDRAQAIASWNLRLALAKNSGPERQALQDM